MKMLHYQAVNNLLHPPCRWDEVMDVPDGADCAQLSVKKWVPGMLFGGYKELKLRKHHPPRS